MKRIILLFSVMLLAVGADAQNDGVRLPQRPKTSGYKDYSSEQKGFWCSVELDAGSSVRFNGKNIQQAQVTYTAGYRFCEYLRVGLGFGGRYYFNNADVRGTDVDWSFPIYANVRGNIISQDNRTAVPFWSFNIGGVVRDGFYMSPTIGYRFGEQRNSFIIGLSYSLENLYVAPGKREAENFVLLKLGYEF